MCGIAGIFRRAGGTDGLHDRLQVMNGALVHRGPDEEGYHVSTQTAAGISIRRLSIVDLEHGSQPLFSEDRSIAVVCNGEIYNHRALRQELKNKGYRLRTHSDCEVLAHLYQEEGVDFLQRLNGMFALAVLDERNNSLLLARDPAGMKHLYWAETDHGFVFASEARALFAAGLVRPEPDWEALAQYFSYGWIESPKTAFMGLKKLQPGSHVHITTDGVSERRYWAPTYSEPERGRSLESYAEELGVLLNGAVETHLDADVPAGLFLSGGWDSSILSLYASRKSDQPLKSYSLTFPGNPASDESHYFRQVVAQIGSRSHEIEVRNPETLEIAQSVVIALEEPMIACPTALEFLLSRAAGGDVKMVIGGEGSDEILAGYDRFSISPLHRLRPFVPHWLVPASVPLPLSGRWNRALRFLAASDEELAHQQLVMSLDSRQFSRVFQGDREFKPHVNRVFKNIDPRTRASFRDSLDIKLSVEQAGRLADGVLFSMDKTSMHHSLEVRMPFLDLEVLKFAHRLPSGYKVRGTDMKRVLGPLASELPPDVAGRRKLGLHTPVGIYQSDPVRSFYAETILETSLATGLFDQQELERWVNKGRNSRPPTSVHLWPLCHFCMWWNHFIDGDAAAAATQPARL